MPGNTVLLLIDDPGFRGGLIPALRAAGIRTIMTGDEEQARALVRQEGPALIVVDGRLPGRPVDWIRARRAEGLATPVVLCGSNGDEMRGYLAMADELGLASTVHRAIPPASLASHLAELLQLPAAVPEIDLDAPATIDPAAVERLSNAVERLRLALVHLQQNPERRERIEGASDAAKKLQAAARDVGAEAARSAGEAIARMLGEAMVGRRRLDSSSFSEIERHLLRAREAAPAATGAPPPPEPRRPGVSVHAQPIDLQTHSGARGEQDDLTGLFTREAFLREANDLVTGALIDSRPLSLCVLTLVDADAFRANRMLDRVVAQTGRFLGSRFRPADRRGRWGDASFALGIPGTPAKMAVDLLQRTLDAFASVRIADANGRALTVRVAAAVVVFPNDGKDASSLLALAERDANALAANGGGVGNR